MAPSETTTTIHKVQRRRSSTEKKQVSVRMYNVGFGDCFLVTLKSGTSKHMVLFDCGSKYKDKLSIKEVADEVVSYIKTENNGRLDVVVATHMHEDHISGFRFDNWESLDIGQVWLPWTESNDPLAKKIRKRQNAFTAYLKSLVDKRLTMQNLTPTQKHRLDKLQTLVENSLRSLNADSISKLTGGLGDASRVRFLPETNSQNSLDVTDVLPDVDVTILGPPRVVTILKDRKLPKDEAYRQLFEHLLDIPFEVDETSSVVSYSEGKLLDADLRTLYGLSPSRTHFRFVTEHLKVFDDTDDNGAPFDKHWQYSEDEVTALYPHLSIRPNVASRLAELSDDVENLLAAASSGHINNTSIVTLFRFGKLSLLFTGDAEWLTWETIMQNEAFVDLLSKTDFLKVGHHGSSNANPKSLLLEVLPENLHAMASTKEGTRYSKGKNPNPDPLVFEALEDRNARILRSDHDKNKLPKNFNRVSDHCFELLLDA